jgi:amino acid adenylation domain-containing protein
MQMSGHKKIVLPAAGRPGNFVEHLRRLAQARPDDAWLTVVSDVGAGWTERTTTYAELDARVRALAACLQGRVAPGARALVMLDNDEHYVVSMLACFFSGVVAVPAFPPESTRPQHAARLQGMVADSKAGAVLTSSSLAALIHEGGDWLCGLDVIAVDCVDPTTADRWVPHVPSAEDLAFLQYTSGSTSTPKGVMVTHGNLMANERAIQDRMGIGPRDKFASWSPLYHDMGLIGGLLQPLYSSIPLVLCSPRFFLERPLRWLQMISRHGATISGGPDFSYRLLVERVKDAQLSQLDLSSWRVAYTGAEPVRADTVTEFCERFAPAGFDPGAVYACYGLAEATLFATGAARGSGLVARRFEADGLSQGHGALSESGTVLVGCGEAVPGHEVRIFDPVLRVGRADGVMGEIWITGPSVAAGYWGRESETDETFVQCEGRRWLRTGDLGFVVGRQLYVTGRIKDLIIVRGHNIYPQDVERHVEAEVDAVRKGRVAAFAVEGPQGEGIGIAAEVSRGLQKLIKPGVLVEALAAAVSEAFGESLQVVVLLNPGGLPRTSSGKLQRSACRIGWERNSLDAYAVFARGRFVLGADDDPGDEAQTPVDPLDRELVEIWRHVLQLPMERQLGPGTHFFTAGGNSLTAVRVAARVSTRWQIEYPPRLVFERPRLQDMAHEVRQRVAEGPSASPLAAPIPRVRRDEPQPLSSAQRRQWFLWQMDPEGAAYHVHGALRLAGRLDVEAMSRALNDLVARHESLRTCFRTRPDGEVEQWVLPHVKLELGVQDLPDLPDLQGRPDANREAGIASAVLDIVSRPFDLHRSPLLRVVLLRLTAELHVLVLVVHHIVSDGPSMHILLGELAAAYSSRREGRNAELPALGVQYVDHAAWQQFDPSARARDAEHLAYWRETLGNDHPVLSLPADHARQPVARHRAARHSLSISPRLLAALRARAEAHQASLFMVLLAGLQVVLHRYTGQHEVRVGVPVANRHHVEVERLVGMFVNTIVQRNLIDGRKSLAQVLDHARAAFIAGHDHQEAPFEQVVEALHPERSLSHNPLFQVMLNHLLHDPKLLQGFTGLAVTVEPSLSRAAQFELTVEVNEIGDDELRIQLIYAADLFAPGTIGRFGSHFVRVLEALADTPELAVGAVGLLGPEELEEITRSSSNETCSSDETILQAVERQVSASPGAIAVVFGGVVVTYGELNERANRLAHHLMERGVGPDVAVGVVLERSVEMVVGLLGILKAGGAYVPVDPQYPEERIGYMLQDSGVGLVLTQAALLERLALPEGVQALALDRLDLERQPTGNPGVALHAQHLAYVIYTSGSTGRPKGAANRHGALHNRLAWMQAQYGLQAGETVLQKTPFGFDVSVWEFFWPLMVGARLAVAPPGAHKEPQQLAELIARHEVSTIHFVPSMLQAFLADEGVGECTSLRRIICSGEALPAQVQNEVLERLPQAGLYNLYGPTEAAIDVTHWRCRDDGQTQVAIGRPIWGTRCWVLDADLNPVPKGVAGELYLGGEGLARGYLGKAGLTAQRFVADAQGRGERLYRTGDLVRWRADGELEYLGRLDHQVKIRGNRIELGEVEAQLLAQPGVAQAVVVAQQGAAGARLVAYVAAAAGARLQPQGLRAALGRELPEYMVPALVQVLEELPLNANGKLDRKALPQPQQEERQGYEAPQGEVEEALAAIWAEVLGLPRVSRHDNFFELGGHSLLATQIAARVRAEIDGSLRLETLFAHPRLSMLAGQLRPSPAPPGTAAASTDGMPAAGERVPLSYAQQRLWFLWRLDPRSIAMNIPAAFRLKGALRADVLEKALSRLVDRHEALRTVFGEDDGRPWQQVLPAGSLRTPWEVLHATQEGLSAAVDAAVRHCAGNPFDLTKGPLLRAVLIRLDALDHVLVVVAHHIVADGWSSHVMQRDLARLYNALLGLEEAPLPPLRTSYAAYALAQQQARDAETLATHAREARQALSGFAPLVLPPDRATPSPRSYPLGTSALAFDAHESQRIRAVAHERNATPFMVLLAATAIVLAQRSGQSRFYVGTDVANRPDPETQTLVGFFVNQIALPIDCREPARADQLLSQVRATVLAASARQELPFDRLVHAVGTGARGSRAPLFQVKVLYEAQPPQAPMKELSWEPLAVGGGEAELDLIVRFIGKDQGIDASLLFDAERFGLVDMQSLARELREVVNALAADPGQELRALAALADRTRQSQSAQRALEHAQQLGSLRSQLKRRKASDAPAL